MGGVNAYIFCRNRCCSVVDIIGLLVSDKPRICRKDYNTRPRKGYCNQELCKYECKCPEGYKRTDLGNASMEIWLPCALPDVVESGSCQRKERTIRRSPVVAYVPQYEPSIEFQVSLSQSGRNITILTGIILPFFMLLSLKTPV